MDPQWHREILVVLGIRREHRHRTLIDGKDLVVSEEVEVMERIVAQRPEGVATLRSD